MAEKLCYQMMHPDARTPCFDLAGDKPCSSGDCAVFYVIAMRLNFVRMLGSEASYAYIVNNLLHNSCRMSKFSPDNEEFRQRTGYGR
jgi:hypothetical protein